MTEVFYHQRRGQLLEEFYRMKSLGLNRSAAARVRKIAKLDLEFDSIPIEKTYQVFGYQELMR